MSVFDNDWLAKRSFRLEKRMEFRKNVSTPQQLWGRELLEDVPTADYSGIMEDDAALLDWLENLDKYGFVLVRNVPVREGPVPALQVSLEMICMLPIKLFTFLKERVAFEKMTHYGPGYTVVVRADPANISHTYHRIFFHTDLTYYDYMPGVRSTPYLL